MKLASKKMYTTLIVLLFTHALLVELCARQDAALVILGAGTFAKAGSIAAMLSMVLVRLGLYLLVPGCVAARALVGVLQWRAMGSENRASGRGMPRA